MTIFYQHSYLQWVNPECKKNGEIFPLLLAEANSAPLIPMKIHHQTGNNQNAENIELYWQPPDLLILTTKQYQGFACEAQPLHGLEEVFRFLNIFLKERPLLTLST